MIQAALEAKEAVQKEEEADEEQGLWHKVEWKMAHTVFERTELSLSERAKGRIGNNFYKVGYRCPKCKENLHMIMYPKGKEFRIETPEGVVLWQKHVPVQRVTDFIRRAHGNFLETAIFI